MSNSVTKKEIKQISRNFRTVANRTLNSDYDTFDNNLKRLINYIESIPIIKDYITSCIKDNDNFEIEKDVEEVSNGYGEYIFDSPINEETEVSYTYQILKCITEKNLTYRSYTIPYSSSSKYQDKVKGFNDKFVLPLINSIDGNLERICIEMGFDEESKYNIYINGGQVNIAKDNATLNATQNNGVTEFDKIIEELKKNLKNSDIDENVKNEILENAEGIQEELNRESPRKGILKSFIEGLNQSAALVPKVLEVGANITAIISFLQPFICQ